MIRSHKKVGEILIEHGLITQEQLDQALVEQSSSNEFLGDILIRNRKINEKALLTVLSKQFNIPFISLNNEDIKWDFVKKFRAASILDYKCVPVRGDEWSVTIGIGNPLNATTIKIAEEEARGLKLNLVLISQADLEGFIVKYKQHTRESV